MGDIQRSPQGLLDLLSCKDMGRLPQGLLTDLRPVLEMMQMYGLQQLQTLNANNAALAEAAAVSITLPTWSVLFSANCSIVKTATMTALRGSVLLNRNTGVGHVVAQAELGPFGATETGIVGVPFVAPYPLLCPPNTVISATCPIIGTDATANVSIRAEFGALG